MSSEGYSSMFIMPNDKVSVENLLKGIIIVSGNDACVALAEGIAGTDLDDMGTDDQQLTIDGDTLFLEDGGQVLLPSDVLTSISIDFIG